MKERPARIPLPTAPRPGLDPRMQHLLDIGVLRPQNFSPTHYQLALESGADPKDPESILRLGPSDAQSRHDPQDTPHPDRRHDTPQHKAAATTNLTPTNLSTKVMRLLTACETLRKIAGQLRTTTAHAGSPYVRVVRDDDGSFVVERER